MLTMRFQRLPVLVLLTLSAFGCQSHTPQGTPADAKGVRQLITTLDAYQQRFRHLMEMRSHIRKQRADLDRRKAQLAQVDRELHADQARLAKGAMTRQHYDHKWKDTQKEDQHAQALKAFQADVARYNKFIGRFNRTAKALAGHIDKRRPADVDELIQDMSALRQVLQSELDNKQYVKAGYVAEHSAIAAEFGYHQQ
jgi:vacuolar-type H+-ATPase subunit I/STV1